MSIPRILHYPGSKWSMAEWIISHMPEHKTYLEPFLGSGAVLFNKPRSPIETVNDLDGEVTNLFEIVRTRPEELARAIYWTPYSRDEYYRSYEPAKDDLERARRFLVRTWQAIGAKTSDRTGWRSHVQADKSPSKTTAWQWGGLPEKLLQVTERLQGVQIENKSATAIIERYKQKNCLIYCDPPYILSTRSNRLYRCEMTEADHAELLDALDQHPGPVLLSGYAHPLYDDRLRHWNRETKKAKAEAGAAREEVLWINPVAASRAGQLVLNL
ncbi:DNA adenine methylase [Paenibacillus melissococcoides]|uniref:site-specific DNA-methyltransferase (adenine-specific) n=1 Tax=Paenibacillus melissococcoides TaxID=2912268 RepID=A0ABM9G7P1_9BACL|nr:MULTISPECIES: DNA adenine methylase [Paenibacillus]MEB9895118.1 DNA adenine methylase [Bacillus cereus]CAH8247387.1 DNA adenine methylase [Paenibacillus melissococcoides]CAH8705295.1 DNA adenine methylase [Paenibacillus melissococcoides]CAH8708516.1 DNA adenine methylase [Paenibacillus melissococcoides]GIO82853.1 SAM-dependent methyltransferase [Paenibacillus dendritiformis]